jgi:hypothetical protein
MRMRMTEGVAVGSFEDPRLEVAQKRLRESIDRADVLEAIREIVTGLLGCEEIALFTVKRGNRELLWSFGIDARRHGTLDSFEESALRRVMQGELHIVEADHRGHGHQGNPPLQIFVPIRLHGRTVAVLVMLKLLPQKLGFDKADVNLVKVLSDETGRALFERSANA